MNGVFIKLTNEIMIKYYVVINDKRMTVPQAAVKVTQCCHGNA